MPEYLISFYLGSFAKHFGIFYYIFVQLRNLCSRLVEAIAIDWVKSIIFCRKPREATINGAELDARTVLAIPIVNIQSLVLM